jgi:pimeloyl-ACP methyl ester carboxylesterase
MPKIELSQTELNYERRGSGEPLLLIQGMGGTHVSWGRPFSELLERDFEVIAFDNRGMGLSRRVGGEFSIAEMAADTAELMGALELETAHVMGISMGGMIAQELALRHPEKVRTLALGCTYCGGPQGRLTEQSVGERLAQAMASGDRDTLIRAMYEVNVSSAYAAEASNFDAFLAMAKTSPAPIPVIMLQAQAIGGHDTSARLPSLDVPTLVVHGDEDQMLDVANGRLIAELIPGAQLEVLPGVGHMFWWEQPQRSAELIRQHALAGAAR